jgi:hypothetical protein
MPAAEHVAPRVRYVCLRCFDAASDLPADCARDGVALAPVETVEALVALRARLGMRAARRETARFGVALLLGAALALPLCLALGWPVVPRASDGLYGSAFVWLSLLSAIVVGAASFALVPPLRSDVAPALLLRRLGLHLVRNAAPPRA